jgi:hypothetical protein
MGLSKQITNYGIIRGLLFGERVSVNMSKWAWIGQHDEIFTEYFIDTWHKILHGVEEYFATCP